MLSPHPPGGPSPGGARGQPLAGGSRVPGRTRIHHAARASLEGGRAEARGAPMLKARAPTTPAPRSTGEIYVVGGKTLPVPRLTPHLRAHTRAPAPTPILPPPPPPPTRATGVRLGRSLEPSLPGSLCFLGRREQDKESVPRSS